MSKIIYNRQETIAPYKVRYLDSLSALFHVHGPCCALVKYKNGIYLSYNSNPSASTEKSINFINTVLKNIKQYSQDALLAIYLTFNMDFAELAKKSINHVDEQDILSNPNNLHAERNITHHFPVAELLDPNYGYFPTMVRKLLRL